MMLLTILAAAVLLCAAIPAVMFVVNLRRYQPPQLNDPEGLRVSVLVPARDEERNIAACLESVLANRGVDLEVLVLDDASTDHTAAIVSNIATRDSRLRLIATHDLPPGWNGKQRACWLLAQEATADSLLFLDADVKLAPDTIAQSITALRTRHVSLLSGFPRQITVGWMEKILLPLIHFVLLGFLPMGRMRKTTKVAYAAGCGQFFLADRTAYFASGGHAAIRETRHDGLRLPQAFRRNGFRTDIVDLTHLAQVRMYDSAGAVWMGLAKNATEGLGSPARIAPLTILLLAGQVLPLFVLALWIALCISNRVVGATFDDPRSATAISVLLTLAVIASYLPRLLAVRRFKQPFASAILHPIGIILLLIVQWYALSMQIFKQPVGWRTRAYASATGEEIVRSPKL